MIPKLTYFQLLGINKSASERDIKKAYRALSKRYHPDKNPGDDSAREKFVEIADAYDALSNEETRKIYDQYGYDGLQKHKQNGGRGGQPGHDPFDLFSRFFGGGGHFGGGQRRGPDAEIRVHVALKEFYTGAEKEFTIDKQVICDACDGSGSADGHVETCSQCSGHGMVIQRHQIAPGMYQQMQTQCSKCGGKGKQVKHACKTCGGQRVVRAQETYTVHIERGAPKGTRINFENEGEQSPDYEAGDLVVQLLEREPQLWEDEADRCDGNFFRRKSKDLFWREVLSLREAWMGDWTRNLTHMDGHIVRLGRKRGQVVQPNQVEVVKGEGMPIYHKEQDESSSSGEDFGALHVEYVVVLPDQMEKGMEKEFREIWDKHRRKAKIDLEKEQGRPAMKQEL